MYGRILEMRIVRRTGDYGNQATRVIKGRYDLALLTCEMFLRLACSSSELLLKVALVVIDDVQFISDSNRGITVEPPVTPL